MPYTVDEAGRLNNFANEPQMYEAQPPNSSQKINFVLLGTGAVTLVGALIYVAFSVS